MGIVYGAGGIWQWNLYPDETGWPRWADSPGLTWREALRLPGRRYAALVSRALAGYDLADITQLPDVGPQTGGKPGQCYCVYLPEGGTVTLTGVTREFHCRWFNPRTGEFAHRGRVSSNSSTLTSPTKEPWLLLAGNTR